MNVLIKHMLDMTGHRDHQQLEASTLLTLQQVTGSHHVRMLALVEGGEQIVLRQQALFIDGKIVCFDMTEEGAEKDQSISCYPVLLNCIQNWKSHAKETMQDGGYRVWLPIWFNGKVGSCIELIRKKAYTKKNLELIEGILGVFRNFDSLLDYSERDLLTGLLNRKTFEKQFSKTQSFGGEQEATQLGQNDRRHSAETRQHWLAVIDIDFFKRINDQFGHLYGDEVLILLASIMNASFRSHDKIFRFGGEEFVVLVHSATRENAHIIMDRFRGTVESHRFPQVGKVTVSIGFTRFLPKESPIAVIDHADQALYYAKSHGRNQTCHYESLVESGRLPGESKVETAPIDYFE